MPYPNDQAKVAQKTYASAPKALLFVSALLAPKLCVMTATNKFKSQKFNTTMQIMKKAQEMKNSEDIIAYMLVDQPFAEAIMMICREAPRILSNCIALKSGFTSVSYRSY
jgi:hypothetical protein